MPLLADQSSSGGGFAGRAPPWTGCDPFRPPTTGCFRAGRHAERWAWGDPRM